MVYKRVDCILKIEMDVVCEIMFYQEFALDLH